MATRSKVPSWIQRRSSERPAARWIAWNTNRPIHTETKAEVACRESQLPDFGDNVVFLFRKPT
ncbi:hypothetical protein [Methylobacterium gnaphalii]|nr:hypothetical protein [Methylobacterium gnaphalii]GJD68452.1 hypothetical protein MMMDOFMJ_1375 [Methylobacterium gnaphalii]